jgi:hypothetical protein
VVLEEAQLQALAVRQRQRVAQLLRHHARQVDHLE